MRTKSHTREDGSEVLTVFAGSDDDAPRMFSLVGRPSVLVNLNPRTERTGDEQRPAADLEVKTNLAADVLDVFDAPLRTMFFADDLVGVGNNLRSAKLDGPFKLKNKFAGYSFYVHFGDNDQHVVLHDCLLNKIRVQPMEGGTCVVQFRLQFHPDEIAAGRLSMLVGSTCDVTMTPPEHGGELTEQDEEEAHA